MKSIPVNMTLHLNRNGLEARKKGSFHPLRLKNTLKSYKFTTAK